MNITPLSNILNSSASATTGANDIMGKDEFLQLLVTQLQNQDPFNPMESQEFAVQLAQFTEVEKLTDIGKNLTEGMDIDMLLAQAVSNSLATNLIGKEVTTYGNSIKISDGDNPDFNFALGGEAAEVVINVKDETGKTVRKIELANLTSGNHSIEWDGEDNDGNALADGNYSFSVEAADVDGNSVKSLTYKKGIVSAIRYSNSAAILIVNGEEIALADVVEVG